MRGLGGAKPELGAGKQVPGFPPRRVLFGVKQCRNTKVQNHVGWFIYLFIYLL